MSNPLDVVGRGSETQLQVGDNSLSPQDTLKHHFISLKTDLIFLQLTVSMKLLYQYMTIFFHLPATLNHLYPLQVGNCDSNSWLVVDEDDNGKFRLERVKMYKCSAVRTKGLMSYAAAPLTYSLTCFNVLMNLYVYHMRYITALCIYVYITCDSVFMHLCVYHVC